MQVSKPWFCFVPERHQASRSAPIIAGFGALAASNDDAHRKGRGIGSFAGGLWVSSLATAAAVPAGARRKPIAMYVRLGRHRTPCWTTGNPRRGRMYAAKSNGIT